MNNQRQINPFGFIAEFDGDPQSYLMEGLQLPEEKLPTLPLRDMVFFTGVVMPVSIGRQNSKALIRKALEQQTFFGIITQLRPEQDELDNESFHKYGVAGRVVNVLEMPDGTITAFIQGFTPFSVVRLSKDSRTVTVRRRLEELPAAGELPESAVQAPWHA